MDYYYNRNNDPNPDVMRIASFHKQKGDYVNFILQETEIEYPFDIFYIIRENKDTPLPPARFYGRHGVKW